MAATARAEGARRAVTIACGADLDRFRQTAGAAHNGRLLFVGRDEADERPYLAARRALGWRYRHEELPGVAVDVLVGGVGADIAWGSQKWNGNWADLVATPNRNRVRITG